MILHLISAHSRIAWALAGAIGYVAFCEWLIFGRGPFRQVYDPFVARLLRWRGMQAITIGPTCYLDFVTARLSPAGEVHERHHLLQQRATPLTFFPRYLYQLARYGYAKMPIEQEARAAAGEPLR